MACTSKRVPLVTTLAGFLLVSINAGQASVTIPVLPPGQRTPAPTTAVQNVQNLQVVRPQRVGNQPIRTALTITTPRQTGQPVLFQGAVTPAGQQGARVNILPPGQLDFAVFNAAGELSWNCLGNLCTGQLQVEAVLDREFLNV